MIWRFGDVSASYFMILKVSSESVMMSSGFGITSPSLAIHFTGLMLLASEKHQAGHNSQAHSWCCIFLKKRNDRRQYKGEIFDLGDRHLVLFLLQKKTQIYFSLCSDWISHNTLQIFKTFLLFLSLLSQLSVLSYYTQACIQNNHLDAITVAFPDYEIKSLYSLRNVLMFSSWITFIHSSGRIRKTFKTKTLLNWHRSS